jgi:hypothetical protein
MDTLPQQPTHELKTSEPTSHQIETVAASSGQLAVAADASLGPDPVRRPLPPQNPLPRFS